MFRGFHVQRGEPHMPRMLEGTQRTVVENA